MAKKRKPDIPVTPSSGNVFADLGFAEPAEELKMAELASQIRRKRLVKRRLPKDRPPTHPGEMLFEELLKPLGISQSAFAIRLGVSFPRLNEIIRGKRSVTPDTALRLARVLGMSADFWLGLQQDWDLWHAMHSEEAAQIEHLEPLRRQA
jgi:antitoxin HigA-1